MARQPFLIGGVVETVSNPRFGEKIFRVSGVIFDLLSKRSNIRSQIIELLTILRAPYRTEQCGVGH
jgi:hypothetical protein